MEMWFIIHICIYIVLFIYGEWDNEINCITCHVPKDIVMRVALLLLKMQWILVLFTPNIGVVYLFPVSHPHRKPSRLGEYLRLKECLCMPNIWRRWVSRASQLRMYDVGEDLSTVVVHCAVLSSRTCRAHHARSACSPSKLSTEPSAWCVDSRHSASIATRS